MWLMVLKIFGELLIKFGLKKKKENDAAKAKSLEKTVESVNKSLEVEDGIRDKQNNVDKAKSDVGKDGGLDFGDWNDGK